MTPTLGDEPGSEQRRAFCATASSSVAQHPGLDPRRPAGRPDGAHALGLDHDRVVERPDRDRSVRRCPARDAQIVLGGEPQPVTATSSTFSTKATAAGCGSAARFQPAQLVPVGIVRGRDRPCNLKL